MQEDVKLGFFNMFSITRRKYVESKVQGVEKMESQISSGSWNIGGASVKSVGSKPILEGFAVVTISSGLASWELSRCIIEGMLFRGLCVYEL